MELAGLNFDLTLTGFDTREIDALLLDEDELKEGLVRGICG
jgi:hypothetical protein